MTPAKALSICASAEVNELFRIASHIQGRMNGFLAEVSVMEERIQLLSSEVGKQQLRNDLISVYDLLHRLNEIIEIWCSLQHGQDRNHLLADLEKVIFHYFDSADTSRDEGSQRMNKYQNLPPEPRPES